MNFGVKDFFIGIVHLFVIFLPGSIALLTLLIAFPGILRLRGSLEVGDTIAVLLFIGTSYFLGHLFSLVASRVEDAAPPPGREAESGAFNAAVRRKAHEICLRELDPSVLKASKLRRWCRVLVGRDAGMLQAGVDAKDADRRFFRNIRFVLVLPLVVCVVKAAQSPPGSAYVTAFVGLAVFIVLAHLRYADQDAKFTQAVFESLIAKDAEHRSGSNPKRSIATHAGGVVYRKLHEIEYLLVRPRDKQTQWVLPKGHIEFREFPEAAAVREVAEETGLITKVSCFLDFTRFKAKGEQVCVANYALRFDGKTVEEHEDRPTVWLVYDEAYDKLDFPEAKSMLERARKLLS